jgi:hypothetical protein
MNNAFKNLEKLLLNKLNDLLDLHPDTSLRLTRSSLEVFLINPNTKEKIFASDVEFFNHLDFDTNESKISINFGSSGSFDPNDIAPLFRTKHAMEFLNNWDESTKLIQLFMEQYVRILEVKEFESKI